MIDVDDLMPNLALMKLSAYHKKKNDKVGLRLSNPDKVYASVVFTDNLHKLEEIKHKHVEVGGTGVDYTTKLKDEIEFLKPDYDLYSGWYDVHRKWLPIDYSMGFTTRGCIRSCDFCIVPEKEGKIKRWQHPEEFHDDRFDKMVLLDNNVLADKDWFFETTEWIMDKNIKVTYNQGLDVRLLDEEVADRLSKLKPWRTITFAWDNMNDEQSVIEGIRMLKNAGIRTRSGVQFYVLTNYNTTYYEDVYRCRKLKELDTSPFVMEYGGGTEFTSHLARWANRRSILWSIDIKDYEQLPSKYKKYVEEIHE